jgi:mono/diheme cytochrome c family protein/ABC-type amino acid transport substrate-binding protein
MKHLLLLTALAGTAHAQSLRVCIDSASPEHARDTSVAQRVADQAKLPLTVVPFDSNADDDVVKPKAFRAMLSTKCDLVMGYPVDAEGGDLPAGFLATKPYAHTGFVLVTAPGVAATRLADLPQGTDVAVTFETAPNLYFANHPNIQADIHTADADTMQAVATGTDHAAMLWQPTVEAYLAKNPTAKLGVHPLAEPHASFNVVALYLPQGAPQADHFNATKISLDVPAGAPQAGALPALFTDTQAKLGYAKFLGNCAMCHGVKLQGRAGPALKGPNWANAQANYTVGEVFTVLATQMPATEPGSLAKGDYEDIMAFILQQNGYPAGTAKLQYDSASASKVPLLYHGP